MENDLEKAGVFLRKGLVSFPNDFQLLFNSAVHNLVIKEYKEAEWTFLKLHNAFSNNLAVKFNLAISLLFTGKIEKLKEILTKMAWCGYDAFDR